MGNRALAKEGTCSFFFQVYSWGCVYIPIFNYYYLIRLPLGTAEREV